jgi:hypothetical protein
MNKKAAPSKLQQGKRFIEAARAAECSEDEAVFDETMKKIVTAHEAANETEFFSSEADYPSTPEGQLVVGHFSATEDSYGFLPVSDRAAADKEFDRLMRSPGVMWVLLRKGPRKGYKSPVVWIMTSRGEGKLPWDVIRPSDGAKENIAELGIDGT